MAAKTDDPALEEVEEPVPESGAPADNGPLLSLLGARAWPKVANICSD